MSHSTPDKSLSSIMAILPQYILCSNVIFNSEPSEYLFSTIEILLSNLAFYSKVPLLTLFSISLLKLLLKTVLWNPQVFPFHYSYICQVLFTLGWKSTEWTRRWADLWNNLGFSLCAMPSVCHVVVTSDDGKKSEIEVSADWCITVEYQRSSSIRDYLHWLSN